LEQPAILRESEPLFDPLDAELRDPDRSPIRGLPGRHEERRLLAEAGPDIQSELLREGIVGIIENELHFDAPPLAGGLAALPGGLIPRAEDQSIRQLIPSEPVHPRRRDLTGRSIPDLLPSSPQADSLRVRDPKRHGEGDQRHDPDDDPSEKGRGIIAQILQEIF